MTLSRGACAISVSISKLLPHPSFNLAKTSECLYSPRWPSRLYRAVSAAQRFCRAHDGTRARRSRRKRGASLVSEEGYPSGEVTPTTAVTTGKLSCASQCKDSSSRSSIDNLDQQCERAYDQYKSRDTDILKNSFLQSLKCKRLLPR